MLGCGRSTVLHCLNKQLERQIFTTQLKTIDSNIWHGVSLWLGLFLISHLKCLDKYGGKGSAHVEVNSGFNWKPSRQWWWVQPVQWSKPWPGCTSSSGIFAVRERRDRRWWWTRSLVFLPTWCNLKRQLQQQQQRPHLVVGSSLQLLCSSLDMDLWALHVGLDAICRKQSTARSREVARPASQRGGPAIHHQPGETFTVHHCRHNSG